MEELLQYCNFGDDQPELSAVAFLTVSGLLRESESNKKSAEKTIREIYTPGEIHIVHAGVLGVFIVQQTMRLELYSSIDPNGVVLQAVYWPVLDQTKQAVEIMNIVNLMDTVEKLLEYPRMTWVLGNLYERITGESC